MFTVTPFTAAGGSDRPNQDAYFAQEHPAAAGVWVCAVADGQGGSSGGAEAANLACRSVLAGLLAARPALLASPARWCGLLQAADQAVAADADAGFTTLLAFALLGDTLVGASSGDSAVLVVPRQGRPTEATARQVKNPPLGSGAAVLVPFELRLARPWSLLAMSDGVWKYVGWDPLVEVARTHHGTAATERLLELARLPGSGQLPDDFTVVLFEAE